MFQQGRQHPVFKVIAAVLTAAMVQSYQTVSYARETVSLPIPGQLLRASAAYEPVQMIGVTVDPKDPLHLSFVMDAGDSSLTEAQKKSEYQKLITQFLVALTVPNKDIWVNLSPYESDRVIGNAFAKTDAGEELLAQDYILKQFTASLTDPNTELGKHYWSELSSEAVKDAHLSKVWISADRAEIYRKEQSAYLVNSHLKVSFEKGAASANDVLLPAIEKEVNEGANFAKLRQVYHAMILATWFKKALRESVLATAYADKDKVAGVEGDDPAAKERIYQRYVEAFRVGVVDVTKKEQDSQTHRLVKRKYFSGGAVGVDPKVVTEIPESAVGDFFDHTSRETVDTDLRPADKAQQPSLDPLIAASSALAQAQQTLTYQSKYDALQSIFDASLKRKDTTGNDVLLYLPADAPADGLLAKYINERHPDAKVFSDIDTLRSSLSHQAALVLIPFDESDVFAGLSDAAAKLSPQAWLVYSGARLSDPDAREAVTVSVDSSLADGIIASRDKPIAEPVPQAVTPQPEVIVPAVDAQRQEEKVAPQWEKDFPDAQDPLWEKVREEAAEIAEDEPLAAESYRQSILNQPDFESAISFLVASKLSKHELLPFDQLYATMQKAIADDPSIIQAVRADLQAVFDSDPATTRISKPLMKFKGFHAVTAYRLAHWLWNHGNEASAELLQNRISDKFGVDIHPAATIGKGIFVDHATGVVIGATAVVGDNVTFLHGVTLGSTGTGVETADGRRHPIIGNGVMLGASAKIIGPVVIGDNVKVGANAVVTKNIPAGVTVVGNNEIKQPKGAASVPEQTIKPFVAPVVNALPPAAKPQSLLAPTFTVEARYARKRPEPIEVATPSHLQEIRALGKKVLRAVERQIVGLETENLDPSKYDAIAYNSGVSGNHKALRLALNKFKEANPGRDPELVLLLPAYGMTSTDVAKYKELGFGAVKLATPDDLYKQLTPNTAAVLFESPANPALKVIDIKKVADTVRGRQSRTVYSSRGTNTEAFLIFDGAFATPEGQQPLEFLGTDEENILLVQVLTKGISGHGNVFGSAIIGANRFVEELRRSRGDSHLSYSDAQKMHLYGIPSFKRRFQEQSNNARALVSFLNGRKSEKDSVVAGVRYPGDSAHPEYAITDRQMKDPGTMIYLDLGREDRGIAFVSLLRYFRSMEHAVSLGDDSTLIQFPGYGALAAVPLDEQRAGGMTPGGIRISVGTEDFDDLQREFGAILDIMKLYDNDLANIPYDQLNEIFMQPYTLPDGRANFILRKLPHVVSKGNGVYDLEPEIRKGIAALATDGRIKRTINGGDRGRKVAELINDATDVRKYNPHTLFVHNTQIYGILSGNHHALVSPDGSPSSAFRAQDPYFLKEGFDYYKYVADLSKSYPALGKSVVYARLGNPVSATVEELVAFAEAGPERSLSKEQQALAFPSFDDAVETLLSTWIADGNTKRKADPARANRPIRIVVVAKDGSEAKSRAKSFAATEKNLFEINGRENVRFDYVDPEDRSFPLPQDFVDADYVLVDEGDGRLEPSRIVRGIKGRSSGRAQVAWVNTEGFKKGVKPLDRRIGADITLLNLKEWDESAAGVLVLPVSLMTEAAVMRSKQSMSLRENPLPNLFPELLLDAARDRGATGYGYYQPTEEDGTPRSSSSAVSDVGGIKLDDRELALEVKGDTDRIAQPRSANTDLSYADIPGLVPVIKSIRSFSFVK